MASAKVKKLRCCLELLQITEDQLDQYIKLKEAHSYEECLATEVESSVEGYLLLLPALTPGEKEVHCDTYLMKDYRAKVLEEPWDPHHCLIREMVGKKITKIIIDGKSLTDARSLIELFREEGRTVTGFYECVFAADMDPQEDYEVEYRCRILPDETIETELVEESE